jgi:DNA-dependent protein kinase catalytic subunit
MHAYIELPGQYTGRHRPQPELHVRIVNFDATMLVMSSLRRPKRLTILGSDERTHHYLVKGGEDLRMDQRVEQVFGAMNEVLRGDTATARRRLALRQYEVIPFSSTLGMLEWVDHTAPLKSLLLAHAPPQIDQIIANKYTIALFNEYLASPDGKASGADKTNKNAAPVYYAVLKCADRKRVVDYFVPLQNQVPHDLVAKSITKLSPTPESFLAFRSNFSRSFAALSMCTYVLGLGDRHLENFLVDTSSGEFVGIDFGAAFGQGVLLSVPELMPIRYTRVLQHMLAPLQTDAILAADMSAVMAALRRRKHKLLTVMQVFIKEPQMEWIVGARGLKHDG